MTFNTPQPLFTSSSWAPGVRGTRTHRHSLVGQLGGHVHGRSHPGLVVLPGVRGERHAEVGHLDVPAHIQQNILRLQVMINYAHL